MKTGLVSITFRDMTPYNIVKLVVRAGLEGIEWGGDIHIPHGDLVTAGEVSRMTKDAGLNIEAYGSYYYAGESEKDNLPFEKVLETAKEMGAPIIRVWAGKKSSDQADESYRAMIVDDLLRISNMVENADIIIACEYHGNTLTDTGESTQILVKEIKGTNIHFYWQPIINKSFEYCYKTLEDILPELANVHMFHWSLSKGHKKQHSLAEGESEWLKYLSLIESKGSNRWALLEFVKNNSPEQFLADAETLKRWKQKIEK